MPAARTNLPVILLVFANDRQSGGAYLRNLALERRQIEAALTPAVSRGYCRLVIEPNVTHARFFDLLALHGDSLAGVHFGGHADPEGLHFEDTSGHPIPARIDGLATALAGLSSLRWVFLNGCATSRHVEALHQADIPTIVATTVAIRDDVASTFAYRFYFALAHGRTFDRAFAIAEGEARSRVHDQKDVLRRDASSEPDFRMLRPAEKPVEWPWVLCSAADGSDSWTLVPERPLPAEGADALTTTLDQRAHLLQTGAPTDVIARLDQRLLSLKRKKLHRRKPTIGLVLSGRWHLLEKIGRGGFAEVWKAWDEAIGENVAVKILHGQFDDSAERRARFFRGARQMAGLKHAHIVPIIEPEGEDGDWRFYVMTFMAGGDLERAVLAGRLETVTALYALCDIADALESAHGRGLVHRDVKPSNILLDFDGRAYLSDFDLVRAGDTTGGTRTGALGTFMYAAPEALEDAGRVTRRCDVYSLGMCAVFILLGRAPPREILRRPGSVLSRTWAHRALGEAVLRAIDWDVERRFSSASRFATTLRRNLSGETERVSSHVRTTVLDALSATSTRRADVSMRAVSAPDPAHESPDTIEERLRVGIGPDSMGARRPALSVSEHRRLIALLALTLGIGLAVSLASRTAPTPSTVKLFVESWPSNAVVFLDGVPTTQRTPTELDNLEVSRPYVLRLERAGYETLEETLQLRPDDAVVPDGMKGPAEVERRFFLRRAKRSLTVKSEPAGAEVYHDGKYLGDTPLAKTLKSSDDDTMMLTLRKRRYRDRSATVVWNGELFKTVEVTLIPEQEGPAP